MGKIAIYMEGYETTGQSAGASHLRDVEAENFDFAVRKLALDEPQLKIDLDRFGKGRHAIWACELFSTFEQARRSFG